MSQVLAYSQLRQAPRQSLRDSAPLPAPLTLFIEPTNICNFRCVYCPESFENFEEKSGGLHRMDLETFHRVADQVLQLGRVKSLNFYMMGEPFVNRSLPDFVKVARQKDIADRITITCNGSLLKEEVSRQVIEAGLDYLRVSIYGGNAVAQARRTQSKIPLARVVENVARFRRLRDETAGRTLLYVKMIDSGSAQENGEFVRLFEGIADEAAIEPVMNWNDPDEGELAQISRDELLQKAYFKGRKEVCPFPFYTLVIHADLRVSVCCVDWAKETVVGDLSKQTLAEVWRGDALRDFRLMQIDRRSQDHSACKNCTYLHTAPDNLDELTREEFLARRDSR